jgi:hypothetical protein
MTPTERIAEIIADRKQRRELRRLKRHRSNEIDEAIRKAREVGPRFHDESDFDHARRFEDPAAIRGSRLLVGRGADLPAPSPRTRSLSRLMARTSSQMIARDAPGRLERGRCA